MELEKFAAVSCRIWLDWLVEFGEICHGKLWCLCVPDLLRSPGRQRSYSSSCSQYWYWRRASLRRSLAAVCWLRPASSWALIRRRRLAVCRWRASCLGSCPVYSLHSPASIPRLHSMLLTRMRSVRHFPNTLHICRTVTLSLGCCTNTVIRFLSLVFTFLLTFTS